MRTKQPQCIIYIYDSLNLILESEKIGEKKTSKLKKNEVEAMLV